MKELFHKAIKEVFENELPDAYVMEGFSSYREGISPDCLKRESTDILRKWAMAVLVKAKTKPEQTIKSLMRKNAMSVKHLVASVNRIFHA